MCEWSAWMSICVFLVSYIHFMFFHQSLPFCGRDVCVLQWFQELFYQGQNNAVQLKHSCEDSIQAPSNLTCTILGAHLKAGFCGWPNRTPPQLAFRGVDVIYLVKKVTEFVFALYQPLQYQSLLITAARPYLSGKVQIDAAHLWEWGFKRNLPSAPSLLFHCWFLLPSSTMIFTQIQPASHFNSSKSSSKTGLNTWLTLDSSWR